ncbi:glycine zipper family protein [Aestuariivita boseongensis]|nr:glycine zipper family protein [Aestuariivita boseongensis]
MERAVVGAVIGCAAGEVLVDGRCVEGALVGAGVGVLTD